MRGILGAFVCGCVLAVALLPHVLSAQPVEPAWPKGDLFWFRKGVEGGNLWLKVDAQHGIKEPLFDHQRLAIELTIRTGVEYTPLTLPFADPATQFVVKYDGSNAYIQEGAMAIEFLHGGQPWRCDLQIKWNWNLVPPTDYECLPKRSGVLAPVKAAGVSLSPDGQWEALVQNHNIAVRPAGGGTPRTLSADGTAAFAYQPGSLQWSRDSKTVTAYRVSQDVWTSNSITGNVKALVVRGQWDVLSTGR